MSKGITLTKTDAGFLIKNDKKDINFCIDINNKMTILKASMRPEFDSDLESTLFLQGELSEFDNELIQIPRKNLKYFLRAIYEYNISINADVSFISEYKFKCSECGKLHFVFEFDLRHFKYCLNCVSLMKFCDNCGGTAATHKFGDKYFCDNCVLHDCCCQNCGTISYCKSLDINIGHVNLCSICWDTKILYGKEHTYNYKPNKYNFWDYDFKEQKRVEHMKPKNNQLYMGIEIESQFNNKIHPNIIIGKVLNFYNDSEENIMYAKHDGTIPHPGSEFVTHPMTLNMFRSLTWKGLFDNIIKPTTYDIGGHIHISKTAFLSPIHVYKFCNFLKTNVKYVEWIGERCLDTTYYKQYSKNGRIVNIVKLYKKICNRDRYEMINFTENTIELRFFWSPFSTQMLLKNVEFVDALYNFTKNIHLKFTYKDFENYIDTFAIKYPYLYNFIFSREKTKSFRCNIEYYNTTAGLGVCSYCGCSVHEEALRVQDEIYHPLCYQHASTINASVRACAEDISDDELQEDVCSDTDCNDLYCS